MDNPHIHTRALFAPKKGKTATKGQKEIQKENHGTMKFYMIIAVASIIFMALFLKSGYGGIILLIFSILVQSISLMTLRSMANTVDLNLPGGFADKLKDVIITTATCSTLSSMSNKFWLLWLWLPGYYTYLIWVNIIGPCIFESQPEAPEISDKKKKKLERKRARGMM